MSLDCGESELPRPDIGTKGLTVVFSGGPKARSSALGPEAYFI